MEPPSSIQALEVNPFQSRFYIKNGSLRRSGALIEERTNKNREITVAEYCLSSNRRQQAHYKRKWLYLLIFSRKG